MTLFSACFITVFVREKGRRKIQGSGQIKEKVERVWKISEPISWIAEEGGRKEEGNGQMKEKEEREGDTELEFDFLHELG